MPKAKGLAQIATRLGVRRDTARDILRSNAFPVGRRGQTHVVSSKHIDGYRLSREALPAWENEGGACLQPAPRRLTVPGGIEPAELNHEPRKAS